MKRFVAKKFVAMGPGYSGSYDTFDEAEAVVRVNRRGGIYKLIQENARGSQKEAERDGQIQGASAKGRRGSQDGD